MSPIQLRTASIGLLLVFIFVTGIWLSRSGKPLNVGLLTIHKLISLLAVVFIAVTVYQVNRGVGVGTVESGAGVVTGLLFLITIISGGLLSTGKPVKAAVLTGHKVTSLLTALSTAVTMYFLQ